MANDGELEALEILASQLSNRVDILTVKLQQAGVLLLNNKNNDHINQQNEIQLQYQLQSGNDNIGVVGGTLNQTLCNYDYYLNSCENGKGGGSSGDTSFIIACSALVLMMTIPGLGLYYGGMVKSKHVLKTILQCLSIVLMVTFMYLIFGYSLAFGSPNPQDGGHSSLYYGDASRLWFWGMNPASVNALAPTVPESAYALYQLMFAIVTHVLCCGSLADRLNFYPMLLFMCIWHIGVYCPVAHSSWHQDGFLYQAGVMDFAGGNVVHISSGMAGLMTSLVLGNRPIIGNERYEPNNILLTYIGASLLWVGWIGFNAGSALSANGQAAQSLLNTQISTAAAALSWMLLEWYIKQKPSVTGMLSGAVAGLVAITPACGWVDQTGAFFIGTLAGPWCYLFAILKSYAGYDDALDAFGVHATGGFLGGVLTGFFAQPSVYGPFADPKIKHYPGVFYNIENTNGDQGRQLAIQLYGVCVTMFYSSVVSYILLKLVDVTCGLRAPEDTGASLDALQFTDSQQQFKPDEHIIQPASRVQETV